MVQGYIDIVCKTFVTTMRLDQLEIYDIAFVFKIFIQKYISQMANDESMN